eukprot:2807084-Pyramimonas_sp.AAC.1
MGLVAEWMKRIGEYKKRSFVLNFWLVISRLKPTASPSKYHLHFALTNETPKTAHDGTKRPPKGSQHRPKGAMGGPRKCPRW